MAMVLVKCLDCGGAKVEKASKQPHRTQYIVVVMNYALEPFLNWNIDITHATCFNIPAQNTTLLLLFREKAITRQCSIVDFGFY